MPAPNRRGFTWLELVIVLVIIAILITLIAPAMLSERDSRRSQCLNNIKNLGLAVQNFQTTKAGVFPLLEDGRHGWPVALLPYLDQPALVREIESGKWSDEMAPSLEIFACSQDDDSFETRGGLSYAINAGYGFFPVDPKTGAITERGIHSLAQDWDGDGEVSEDDRLMTRATGIAWRKDDVVPTLTVDDVGAGDGLGNTLLFLENLHAGPWTSRDVRAIGIVIDRNRLTFATHGEGPTLDVTHANLGPFAVQASVDATGPVPAPSSGHEETLNCAFADGRASSLNTKIDPLVYARLLTPQGSRYHEHAPHGSTYE